MKATGGTIRRLNGWTRLGIVLTLVWFLVVGCELFYEYSVGPWGPLLITDMQETGEPVLAEGGGKLVPVNQVINISRFAAFLIFPIVLMWAFGVACAWVLAGFRRTD
jgi:hypothetical protein